MPIRFECESCSVRVKVPDGSNGRRVKCPSCGRVQVISKSSPKRRAVVAAAVAAERAASDAEAERTEARTMRSRWVSASSVRESVIEEELYEERSKTEPTATEPAHELIDGNDDRDVAAARQAPAVENVDQDDIDEVDRDESEVDPKEPVDESTTTFEASDDAVDDEVDTESSDDEQDDDEEEEHAESVTDDSLADDPDEDSISSVAAKPECEDAAAEGKSEKRQAVGTEFREAPATLPETALEPEPDSIVVPVPGISLGSASESATTGVQAMASITGDHEQTAPPSIAHLLWLCWALRILALFSLGAAVKLMLVYHDSGASLTDMLIVLPLGLGVVAAIWAVGEIAGVARHFNRPCR